MKLRRHEWWRLQYRNDRYMKHLNINELNQRFKDVLTNLLTLTPKGTIGCRQPKRQYDSIWIELATHLLEEYKLRGGIPRDQEWRDYVPKVTYPKIPEIIDIIKKMTFPDNLDCLFKYGKYSYLQDFYENGRLLISPASYYSDPSLNKAQRDDELNLDIEFPPTKMRIKKPSGIVFSVDTIGNVEINIRAVCDYYVYCLSGSIELRIFGDFQSDCCIFIHKPKEFCSQIIDSCKNQFRKDIRWNFFQLPVRYVDPLNPSSANIDIFSAKHFRYWYQLEHRIVWIPQQTIDKLEPIFVDVGDIKKYCDLITPS